MSEQRKYGADALFYFPLIEDGDADFATDYTPAANDTKIFTDKLISTNPTALILGFDSLSELPAQGATIDENGGNATGVIAFTVIISGTVSGTDAAGFFFLRSVTNTWTNNDQIDINGGNTNIATADSTTYDLAATAGLIAYIGNGMFAACLSPTEMTCAQGQIHIVDSATKAIEDQAIQFTTFGNASALVAMDFDDSVRGGLTALPNAAADGAFGLPISDAGGLDLDTKLANTNEITGVRMAVLTDWIDAGRLDVILDAILVDTAVIGALGVGLTDLGGMSTSMKAEVNAEVDTAFASYDGPTDTEMIAAFTEIKGATWASSDSLENIRDEIVVMDAVADAIKVVTDKFVFTVANQVDSNALQIEGGDATDAIKTAVNAALDTAITELGVAQPTATPTLRTGLMLLYMALRNRLDVDTSGTDEMIIHNSAGTKITGKLLTDGSGDYSEAKCS